MLRAMKVPRVVRHDASGAFVLHDRSRFTITWDASAGAHTAARREHYVWVERGSWGDEGRAKLLLYDERGGFLGDAVVAKSEVALTERDGARQREDLDELVG
jgi:hypothetical protein